MHLDATWNIHEVHTAREYIRLEEVEAKEKSFLIELAGARSFSRPPGGGSSEAMALRRPCLNPPNVPNAVNKFPRLRSASCRALICRGFKNFAPSIC